MIKKIPTSGQELQLSLSDIDFVAVLVALAVLLAAVKGFSWLFGEQLGKLSVLVASVVFFGFLIFIFRLGCGLMRESVIPEACQYAESFEAMKSLFYQKTAELSEGE